MSAAFPPVVELAPQAGPMLLLDRVLAHDARRTRCAVDPAKSFLFQRDDGLVPSWVALEYMAQCAAVHGGLRARSRDDAPPRAVFAGSRRLVFDCDAFPIDVPLEVTAIARAAGASAASFECRVGRPGRVPPLARGRLLVALLREPAVPPVGASI